MPNPDTEEWKISATLDYVQKVNGSEVRCDTCGGSGMVGGGFKSLSDPETCGTCFGKRTIWKRAPYPNEPKPDLPQDLVDHMRKAYLEYKLK